MSFKEKKRQKAGHTALPMQQVEDRRGRSNWMLKTGLQKSQTSNATGWNLKSIYINRSWSAWAKPWPNSFKTLSESDNKQSINSDDWKRCNNQFIRGTCYSNTGEYIISNSSKRCWTLSMRPFFRILSIRINERKIATTKEKKTKPNETNKAENLRT